MILSEIKNFVYLTAVAWFVLSLFALAVRTFSRLINKTSCERKPKRTLVFLGSGGHTSEMLDIVSHLNLEMYSPLAFVLCDTDRNSKRMAEDSFSSLQNKSELFKFYRVRRAREVGQSWRSTFFSFLVSLMQSAILYLRFFPDVILTNGPGTCVPICFASKLLSFFFFRGVKLVYIESFCRVETLSLSGKILYPISNGFFVHWPELAAKFPKSRYVGRIM